MAKIMIPGYLCERCSHNWTPRKGSDGKTKPPIVCPKCKSPYWNIPKNDKKDSEEKTKDKTGSETSELPLPQM